MTDPEDDALDGELNMLMRQVRAAAQGPFGNSPAGRHNAGAIRNAIRQYAARTVVEVLENLPAGYSPPELIAALADWRTRAEAKE